LEHWLKALSLPHKLQASHSSMSLLPRLRPSIHDKARYDVRLHTFGTAVPFCMLLVDD
jgi:hypothetical protein